MSKQINKIFSMIQTELKSEKVELNLINDAKQLIKSLDAIFEYKQKVDKPIAAGIEKLKSLSREVAKAKSDVGTYISIEKMLPKFESQLKEAFSTLNFLDKAAKELGVKTESMQEFKDLDDTIFVAKRDIEYLKKVADLAKKTLKDF